MALKFKKKPIVYSFGPEGRDACWAALTSSFNRLIKQPNLVVQPVQSDNSQHESQFSEAVKESWEDSGSPSNLSDIAQTSSVETNEEKCDFNIPSQLPELLELYVHHLNCLVVDDQKCNHVRCWPNDLALVGSNNKHIINNQDYVKVLSEDRLNMQILLQQTSLTNDFGDWTDIDSGWCEDIEKQLLPVGKNGNSTLQESPTIQWTSPPISPAEKTLVADDIIETSFNLSTSLLFSDGDVYNHCYRTNIELFNASKLHMGNISKLQLSHETRIKEIDNSIVSFCILSSVLFVVLLWILS